MRFIFQNFFSLLRLFGPFKVGIMTHTHLYKMGKSVIFSNHKYLFSHTSIKLKSPHNHSNRILYRDQFHFSFTFVLLNILILLLLFFFVFCYCDKFSKEGFGVGCNLAIYHAILFPYRGSITLLLFISSRLAR
jgi:hypothetical protein